MDLHFIFPEAVSEDIESGGCRFITHDIHCFVLTEVLRGHIEEVFFLSWLERDIVLPELALDLAIVLVWLLLQVLSACLVHDILNWLDHARRIWNDLLIF